MTLYQVQRDNSFTIYAQDNGFVARSHFDLSNARDFVTADIFHQHLD
jgi:hypothetical protein